jgi:hypothetical protein
VNLLSDPGDDGEVLGEVGGQDPGDPVRVQILQLAQFWKKLKDSLDESVLHRHVRESVLHRQVDRQLNESVLHRQMVRQVN